MVRTQIYLEETVSRLIRTIAHQSGKKTSEIIREAVDRYLALYQTNDYLSRLQSAKGMWKDRDDLPDIENLRREWDKRL